MKEINITFAYKFSGTSIFIESHNLWRLSGPKPLLKQGHLQPVVQDCIQITFDYLQGWRLHNLPGQPVPLLSHPHSGEVFPDVE